MRILRNFCLYIFVVAFLGALLACPLYELLQWWGIFVEKPFRRIANRSFILVALVWLYPFVKSLKVKEKGAWGLRSEQNNRLVHIQKGLLLGLGTMSLLVILEWWTGLLIWDERINALNFAEFVWLFVKLAVTAITVSFIEEALFRGFLLSILRNRLSIWGAVVTSSFIFTVVHFVGSKGHYTQVKWFSGFVVLKDSLHYFQNFDTIGPFLALLVVGLFLSVMRIVTGSIYFSVGIHAGWVFCIQIGRKLLNPNLQSDFNWLINGFSDKMTGYSSFFMGTGLLLITMIIYKQRLGLSIKTDQLDNAPSKITREHIL